MQYLSKKQKAHLCQLARQAWEDWPGREAFLADNPDYSQSAAYAAWRHVQQREACGIESLRSATNDHYLRLRAHWKGQIGDYAGASRDADKAAHEGRGRALYLIEQSCLERGLDYPAYPGAICRRQYKCALEAASERQLWRLLYTVRSRRNATAARGN